MEILKIFKHINLNRRDAVNWQLKHSLGMKRQIVIPVKPLISCFIFLCSIFVKMWTVFYLLYRCGRVNIMICRDFPRLMVKGKSFKTKAEIFKPKYSYELQAIVSVAYYNQIDVFCT